MKKTIVTLSFVLICMLAKSQTSDSLAVANYRDNMRAAFLAPADSVIKTDTSIVLMYGHILLPISQDGYAKYLRFKQVYQQYEQSDSIDAANYRNHRW